MVQIIKNKMIENLMRTYIKLSLIKKYYHLQLNKNKAVQISPHWMIFLVHILLNRNILLLHGFTHLSLLLWSHSMLHWKLFASPFPITKSGSSLRAKSCFISLCLPFLAYQTKKYLRTILSAGRKVKWKARKESQSWHQWYFKRGLKEVSRTQIIIFW